MIFFKRTAILFFLTAICAGFSVAQALPEPRQEKLLNGLKVLMWRTPQDAKVMIKLRIHNGSAFDPKDKMGTTALLTDILFPNIEDTKAYFTEELEGSLDVAYTYDYMQITAIGRADKFQTMMDAIANAITNPPITPENFTKVRDVRLAKIKELEKDPAYVADRAVAKRLFGDFPYGRSADGTSESLLKIDRPDLLLARDRFLTADNATLAVAGNIDQDAVYRLSRQLFGAWEKADKKTPATFRQPDAPATTELAIDFPTSDKAYSRSAIAVTARNAKDFYATQIFFKIREKQFCLTDEKTYGVSSYRPYLLRGVYIVSKYAVENQSPMTVRQPCQANLRKDGQAITPGDFDSAKLLVKNDYQQKAQSIGYLTDLWLDVDTYKLVSVKDEMSKLDKVTIVDVQRISEDLQKQPMVKVLVKKSEVAKQ